MENAKTQRIKVSMNHGLVVGLILIVFAFLISTLNSGSGGILRLLHWAVIIGAVYYSTKTWRDNYNEGFLSYGQALGFGFRTMFFASIIYGFYSIIYVFWINPGILEIELRTMEEAFYLLGLNDNMIDERMEMAEKMQTPFLRMFTTILGTTFSGFIISLIVALFVRKDSDPFQKAMGGIEEEDAVENQ